MSMKHRRRRRKSNSNDPIFNAIAAPDEFIRFIMRKAQVAEPRARVIRELIARASA